MGQENRTAPKLTRAAARRQWQIEESLAAQGPPPKATGTFWSMVVCVSVVVAQQGGDTTSHRSLAGDAPAPQANMDASREPNAPPVVMDIGSARQGATVCPTKAPPMPEHSAHEPGPTSEAAGIPVMHEPRQADYVVQHAVQSAFAAVVGVPEIEAATGPVHGAQGHESDADMIALAVPEVGDTAGGFQVAQHCAVQAPPMPAPADVQSPEADHAQVLTGTQETPSMLATSSFQLAPGAVLGRIRDPAGNFKMAEIPFR